MSTSSVPDEDWLRRLARLMMERTYAYHLNLCSADGRRTLEALVDKCARRLRSLSVPPAYPGGDDEHSVLWTIMMRRKQRRASRPGCRRGVCRKAPNRDDNPAVATRIDGRRTGARGAVSGGRQRGNGGGGIRGNLRSVHVPLIRN